MNLAQEVRGSRRLRIALVLAVAIEHALFIARPLDVLWPVSAHALGQRLLHGDIPYRDFQFEYPPFALVAFLLPGLVPLAISKSVLAIQATLIELVTVVVVLKHFPGAIWRYTLLSLFAFPFLSGGFDAIPMAAICISTFLLASGSEAGWWVAAIGTLAKLSPGIAWVWGRTKLKVGVLACVVTAGIAIAPLAMAEHPNDSYIGYTLNRGVQMESVASSVRWIWSTLSGAPLHYAYRFRSWEVDGAGSISTVVAVMSLLGLALVAIRGKTRSAWLLAMTSLLLLWCGSKVLSPQFITWAAPVAAVLGGIWFAFYWALMGLTLLIYTAGHEPMGLIFARNLLLVGVTLYALRTVSRSDKPMRTGSEPVNAADLQ